MSKALKWFTSVTFIFGIFLIDFSTLSFDEQVLGWTSRFSYKPDLMGSLRNNFYSKIINLDDYKLGDLYIRIDCYRFVINITNDNNYTEFNNL